MKTSLDPAESHEASYWLDIASELDGPVDILSEKLMSGIKTLSSSQARHAAQVAYQWHKETIDEDIKNTHAETISKVVAIILSGRNGRGKMKFKVYCLAYACNLASLNGLPSMRQAVAEINKECGTDLTVAAMSKETITLRDLLDLRTNANFKSASAVASYQKVQEERHWRREKMKRKKEKTCK